MHNVADKKWVFTIILFVGFVYIGYYLERIDTLQVLSSFVLLFGIYVWIYHSVDERSINFWIYASIGLRLIFLISIPNLSDDVYRYLWDGRLFANGIHPFAEVPEYFFSKNILPITLHQELFNLVGSKPYFTIYPPVSQGVFWVAAKLSPQGILVGIIVIRIAILAVEMGSLFLIKNLLKTFALPSKNILLYALNPLVILELSGNLHQEAFMIFFLLLTIYFLQKNHLAFSAIAFAFAICAKLIPLMFFPLLLLSFRSLKKALLFSSITFVTTILLFIPLLDWEIVSGFNESFSYYFRKFEFNASIYYLVREWGFWKYGYNIVQTVGWKLGLLSAIGILLYTLISYFKNHQQTTNNKLLFKDLSWIYGIYLLFTTILHPWYAIPLLAFSIFTKYRFAILWTFLIFFTYAGYTESGYQENLAVVFIEYTAVLAYLFYELRQSKLSSAHATTIQ